MANKNVYSDFFSRENDDVPSFDFRRENYFQDWDKIQGKPKEEKSIFDGAKEKVKPSPCGKCGLYKPKDFLIILFGLCNDCIE